MVGDHPDPPAARPDDLESCCSTLESASERSELPAQVARSTPIHCSTSTLAGVPYRATFYPVRRCALATSVRSLVVFLALVSGCGARQGQLPPNDQAQLRFEAGGLSLVVRGQSNDEAFDYLRRTLRDMPFFAENGYDVALPDHPSFGPETAPHLLDGVELRARFSDEVYTSDAFAAGLSGIDRERATLQAALARYATFPVQSGFRTFEEYLVLLTLYGPGGSYDPDTGVIVLLTDEEGQSRGGGPVHTIIHEIMHLAIERDIVREIGLDHWETERVVDLLVRREFGDLLPDYALQSMGNPAVDPFIEGTPLAEIRESLTRYRMEQGAP